MSIEMNVAASQNQASSVSSMTTQHIQGYEQLQIAINGFTQDSPLLTGEAYDSAKAYFAEILYPLAQGGILLSEAVERAVDKLPAEYIAQVDSGDLKQVELEEKIRQASHLITQAEEIGSQLRSAKTPDGTKSVQLSANNRMIEMYGTVKGDLEAKLYKLMAFNASSTDLFSEIEALAQAVNQGLAQTTTAFNAKSGTFSLPQKEKLAWRATITDKWSGYVERHSLEDKMEVRQSQREDGQLGYQVYKNGELDSEETRKLVQELAKED